ncbi:hypothetical protein CVT24_013106 [Panaeolus cyanescens]|uniref:Uncharacterized protein n=1 Tax=Panaeolus cyanescens TaxID=181874 RepID=A0A409YN83_9AGAR|nr:hypothetical protein CVT24_013106 [Panaeolus cyanescens]
MLSKLFTVTVALVASVTARPSGLSRLHPNGLGHHISSFNDWHDLSSFHNFDNFYGSDNFIGHIESQVVVKQDSELVCHTQAIEIIQQRLLVLQEMAKRIITEQVCEVETQTVVFEQFHASLGLFRHDLHRTSGFHAGFDSSIASHFSNVIDASSSSLTTDDFGFSGHDLGKNTFVVGGSNWNDATSPASVGAAFSAARNAISL